MRNYVKPEAELVKFTTEAITSNPGMSGGTGIPSSSMDVEDE